MIGKWCRRLVVVLGFATSIGWLAALAFLLANEPARSYIYREISYQYVAMETTRGATAPYDKLQALISFIQKNEHPFAPGPELLSVVDTTAWHDLSRSIAWCDQQSNLLSQLSFKIGFDGRMLFLRDAEGISPHSVAEINIDGRWILADPFYDTIPSLLGTQIGATFEDIIQNPSIISKNSRYKANGVGRKLAALYKSTQAWFGSKLIRWTPVSKKKRPAQRYFERILKVIVGFSGKYVAFPFQDFHLSLKRSYYPDSVHPYFYYARNYQLYGRNKKAVLWYSRYLEQKPDNVDPRALFLMLQLYTDMGRIEEAHGIYDRLQRTRGSESYDWIILGDLLFAEMHFRGTKQKQDKMATEMYP